MRLSIAICTFNRLKHLKNAINSALASGFDHSQDEILVVDGDAGDGTREYIAELSVKVSAILYIHQTTKGLPKARNLAMENARGKYLAFLDDDAVTCEDWVRRAVDIMNRFNPICFGGPFYAMYESQKPDWYLDEYGSVSYGENARWLRDEEYLCGGNIFFRRESILQGGGFDPEFGVENDNFVYGEEAVPQIRLRKQFPSDKFYCDPLLSIRHLVTPQRMKLRWCLRQSFEMGRGYAKLKLSETKETRWFPFYRRFVQEITAFLGSCLIGLFWRDRSQYPFPQNYIIEISAQHLRGAGIFWGMYSSVRRTL